MKYVILRTRFFDVADQKIEERREVIDQVFDFKGAAEYFLEDLELYHGRGNGCSVYCLEQDERCEPIYEIVPIAA